MADGSANSDAGAAGLERPGQKRVIGIVGGLGPLSHLRMESELLRAARRLLDVRREQDYPEWVLSSVPQTPDRTLGIQQLGEDPTPWLLRSLRRLEAYRTAAGEEVPGADFAVVVCNTAHHYLGALRGLVTIPILDMIDETARALRAAHDGACVGVLATTGTLEAHLYDDALRSCGLRPASLLDAPDGVSLQQELVMESIYGRAGPDGRLAGGIKQAGATDVHRRKLATAAKVLAERCGADVIVAGCTEISMALCDGADCCRPVVDPIAILAEAAIRLAYDLPEPAAGGPLGGEA